MSDESDDISQSDLAASEKIFGLSFTDAERDQILPLMDTHLDRLRVRRSVELENHDAPALTFDPRLKTGSYPAQFNKLELAERSIGSLPATDEGIAFASVVELAEWMRRGELTSARLTDVYLGRINKYASKLECFVTVTAGIALEQARQADQERAAGKVRGPLHGIPFVLKDLIDTKDIATTWGATPYKGRVATEDAAVTKTLREAGAVLLGKTTLGALAYGDIWFGGLTRNPWNLQEGSSGSSAGSASATAAGLCAFGIGSETLGSIISPSDRCGTVGLRPTFGRVSRCGAMALCWSLDKLGPLCRSAEDTALVLSVINGYDANDAGSIEWGFEYGGNKPLEGIKVGYDPAWFNGKLANPIDRLAFDALSSLGVSLQEISIPNQPYEALYSILEIEAAAAFEELTLSNKDDELVWQGASAWPNKFRIAQFLSGVNYIQTDRFRRQLMQMMDGFFKDVDLIVGPSFASNLLSITNFTGHPCMALPAGLFETESRALLDETIDRAKLISRPVPQSISIWGRLFEEGNVIRLGNALEEKLRFIGHRPPIE